MNELAVNITLTGDTLKSLRMTSIHNQEDMDKTILRIIKLYYQSRNEED